MFVVSVVKPDMRVYRARFSEITPQLVYGNVCS